MKIRRVSYTLHNGTETEELGYGTAQRFRRWGAALWPKSIVYICPSCGDAWGRVQVDFSGWSARLRRCPRHGPGLLLPPNLDGEFVDFPPAVLRREIVEMAKLSSPANYHPYLITGDRQ